MAIIENYSKKTPVVVSWNSFFCHLQKDIKLMVVFIICMCTFRAFLIWYFSNRFSNVVGLYDIFLAFANGLRFDAVIAGYLALPVILCSFLCGVIPVNSLCNRLRKSLAVMFLSISAVVFIMNFLFIKEFNDNFNHWVFGAIYDDFSAVIKTMWKDYPLVLYFGMSFLFVSVMSYLGIKFIKNPFLSQKTTAAKLNTPFSKTLTTLAVLVFFTISIRGSIGTRPVQLRDAAMTRDDFLNKLVPNPYYAFKSVLKQYHKLSSARGIKTYLPNGDIKTAAKLFFNTSESLPTLDDYMRKFASGPKVSPPRHIFLIVMESLDAWSLLDQYKAFDLLPNIKKMGEEGILVKSFISASSGTMTSLSAIVTGLPDAGVYTNYQLSAQKPFPTSLPMLFKKLGYTTNLFYGGYLSWQKIGDFCKAQGFDNVIGGGKMGAWQNKEWGVDDDVLFEFIRKNIKDDKPTFNLILTTSYHSPYDLPVYEKGFPYKTVPDKIESQYDGDVPLKVFGHLWYSDKLLAAFIRDIERKLPGSLFAVTGDHWSRKFLNQHPTIYESASVPLLLYGKNTLNNFKAPKNIAGSHIDIIPTLIELAAPKGFEYYSMGHDMLSGDDKPVGIGVKWVITPNFIINNNGNMEYLPFKKKENFSPDYKKHLLNLYHAYHGIGWWRIMKGPNF